LRKVAVLACALAVAAALFAGGPAHAQSLPEDVERELNCVCGCSINFEDCVCDTATAIRESAAGMLETGRTTLEVLDGLVAQYGEEVLLSFDGSSSTDENPDTSTPDADPIVVDPDAGITIIEPDPAAVAPTPDAGAIPGAIDGGSNIMTWLLPLLGAVGGGSAVLVAVQVVRRRREPALATRQARRRQDRRKAKRGSRR
jgi:cytochrome c-type biogenesis protein CcmH/NrfF